jgi:predicted RNA-binding protein YlxR (DUF448 family)
LNADTQISESETRGSVRAAGFGASGGGRRGRERMCLVTRTVKPESELIRFVAGPDGAIVPDLQARLPGRGVWISAERKVLDEAVRRKVFARGLKAEVSVPGDLSEQTARLLSTGLLGRLGLARKAGQLVAGFAKVAAAIDRGQASMVLVASDAADDGRRKMQAVIHRRYGPGGGPELFDRWSSDEMSLAIGRTNVIHAAVLDGAAGQGFKQAAMKLLAFEGMAGEDAGEPQDSDV